MLCPWWARHETPVLASPLRIIHVDEELLVLDKPCSLPVSHALGPFYHQSDSDRSLDPEKLRRYQKNIKTVQNSSDTKYKVAL